MSVESKFPNLVVTEIPAPDYTGQPTKIDYTKNLKKDSITYNFMKKKNNITTGGYFLSRLRDSGFIAIRLFKDYPMSDPRKWTMMVDPGGHSLMITCYVNKDSSHEAYFEFNDGGNRFKNYKLNTQSMEIVITTLIEKGVPQKEEGNVYTSKTSDVE